MTQSLKCVLAAVAENISDILLDYDKQDYDKGVLGSTTGLKEATNSM